MSATEKLTQSNMDLSIARSQVEDLKLQLDDALGVEDMVVTLTERNLMLGEVCYSSNRPRSRLTPG